MSLENTPANAAPPASLTIQVDGAEREIFMSFALLNRLAYLLGDADQVHLILMNPAMRDIFLKELLAERTKGGKVSKELNVEDLEISLLDIENLLTFASEHILDFTMRAVEKAQALSNKTQARMSNLKSIVPGPVA